MDIQDAIESIDRYVQHGIPCGGFLTAVLENNLMEAMGRADESSKINLCEICRYIYNDIPSNAHGSPASVQAYLKAKRAEKAGESVSDQGDGATQEPAEPVSADL